MKLLLRCWLVFVKQRYVTCLYTLFIIVLRLSQYMPTKEESYAQVLTFEVHVSIGINYSAQLKPEQNVFAQK